MKYLLMIISFYGFIFLPIQAFAEAYQWEQAVWDKVLNTADKETYLSGLEKDIITHMNRVRSNPSRYSAEYIDPRVAFFNEYYYKEPGTAKNFLGLKTQEGKTAVIEADKALKKQSALSLLKPNEALYNAAKKHADDQSKTGATGHKGSDGSNPQIRVKREGQWLKTMGENIAYGPDNGREVVVELLIDDGVKSRGHRKNILNPAYAIVGVACASHSTYKVVCVMDFAGGMK